MRIKNSPAKTNYFTQPPKEIWLTKTTNYHKKNYRYSNEEERDVSGGILKRKFEENNGIHLPRLGIRNLRHRNESRITFVSCRTATALDARELDGFGNVHCPKMVIQRGKVSRKIKFMIEITNVVLGGYCVL